MERLTERDESGHWRIKRFTKILPAYWQACNRLAAYEDAGLAPDEVRELATDWCVCKQALEEYRASGLIPADLPRAAELVNAVPPCKIGDTIWLIRHERHQVIETRVRGISFTTSMTDTILYFEIGTEWGSGRGKSWALTCAEAEAALSVQKCGNADCPYQERTDCPAADGYGGFEAALAGGDGDEG